MRDVVIAGIGMTRFGKFLDRSVRSLAGEATATALQDAELGAPDVEAVFFSNATSGLISGQEMVRGQVALRDTGLLGLPIVNVENACASASTAVRLAWTAVGSGQCDVALAVGAEKLTHPDKQRSFDAIGSAIDLERRADLEALLYGGDADGVQPGSGTLFMDVYADMARRYMERSGATPRDFAHVTVKNHRQGALNPNAQYGDELTIEQVLESRTIADPLTLLMCAPIGDGAAALVISSAEHARPRGRDGVRLRACSLVSGTDAEGGESAPARAARAAYEQAGLRPEDIDVAEVHDAAAPAELIVYEELGLCGPGEAPALLASGATALGGRVPVNPSGGLLSKGHPVGATGCAQLVELAEQLRGRAGARLVEGARVGLSENAGGYLGPDHAVAAVTILSAA